jgi:hypothetical protein
MRDGMSIILNSSIVGAKGFLGTTSTESTRSKFMFRDSPKLVEILHYAVFMYLH